MYRRIGTIPTCDTILLRWHVIVVMFGEFDVKSMAHLPMRPAVGRCCCNLIFFPRPMMRSQARAQVGNAISRVREIMQMRVSEW